MDNSGIPERAKLRDFCDMDGAVIDSQRVSESIVVDEWLAKWKGFKHYKRVQAFVALDGERKYQESLHKKAGQDPISIPGELALLKVYLDKAFIAYADTFGDPGEKPTMDILRKIGAICLRAMENYGCPLRDIEGSLAARPPEHRATVLKVKAPVPLPTEDISNADVSPDKVVPLDKLLVFEQGSAALDVKKAHDEDIEKSTESFLQRAWDADLAEKCSYPDLRKNAECQACNIGGCEFDLRPDVVDPSPEGDRPDKEINEAGFHEVD